MRETRIILIGGHQKAMREANSYESYFLSDDYAELKSWLKSKVMLSDVLSLDIFDTLLLRDEKSELERFNDISERFVAENPEYRIDSKILLTSRIFSASNSYALSGLGYREALEEIPESPAKYGHGMPDEYTREGNLEAIARNMARSLRIPESQVEEFTSSWMKVEIQVEATQLKLSPLAQEIISYAISCGKRVIALTDMYLKELQIRMLFKAMGLPDEVAQIEVFSSADLVLNKRTGTVFPKMTSHLGVKPEKILHIGDSLRSDFSRAKASGWDAVYLPTPRTTLNKRFESHKATSLAVFGKSAIPLPMGNARPEY